MTAWTDPDRAIVSRYLGKLRLRSANKPAPTTPKSFKASRTSPRDAQGCRPADARGVAPGKERVGIHRPCCTVPASSIASSTIWSNWS